MQCKTSEYRDITFFVASNGLKKYHDTFGYKKKTDFISYYYTLHPFIKAHNLVPQLCWSKVASSQLVKDSSLAWSVQGEKSIANALLVSLSKRNMASCHFVYFNRSGIQLVMYTRSINYLKDVMQNIRVQRRYILVSYNGLKEHHLDYKNMHMLAKQ